MPVQSAKWEILNVVHCSTICLDFFWERERENSIQKGSQKTSRPSPGWHACMNVLPCAHKGPSSQNLRESWWPCGVCLSSWHKLPFWGALSSSCQACRFVWHVAVPRCMISVKRKPQKKNNTRIYLPYDDRNDLVTWGASRLAPNDWAHDLWMYIYLRIPCPHARMCFVVANLNLEFGRSAHHRC